MAVIAFLSDLVLGGLFSLWFTALLVWARHWGHWGGSPRCLGGGDIFSPLGS